MNTLAFAFRNLLQIILIFLVLYSAVARNLPDESTTSTDDTCKTEICQSTVETIKDFGDPKVKPCYDFYKYSCGGWQAKHTSPFGVFDRGPLYTSYESTSVRVKEILEADDKTDDLESLKAARKFYRTCRHYSNDRNNITTRIVSDKISAWGGIPSDKNWEEAKFDWKKVTVDMERSIKTSESDDVAGYSPLIRLNIEQHPKNSSRLVLHLQQAKSFWCQYYDEDNPESLLEEAEETAIFIQRFADLFEEDPETKIIENNVTDVLQFATRFCEILNEDPQIDTDEILSSIQINFDNFTVHDTVIGSITADFNESTVTMNVNLDVTELVESFQTEFQAIPLGKLQEKTDKLELTHDYAKVDWLLLIKQYLNGSGVEVTEDNVYVHSPQNLLNLIKFIDQVPQRTLASYMILHELLWYSDFMMHEDPWFSYCSSNTEEVFAHAVGQEYARLHFDEEDRETVLELAKNILDSFVEDLKHIDWMDEKTRFKAIEKAENIIPVVGYPDWYKNRSRIEEIYSEYNVGESHFQNLENARLGEIFYLAKLMDRNVGRDIFADSPTVINSAYYVVQNIISIPAGIIQRPFYVKGRPQSMNYGALGQIIGHEITHAFDTDGRKTDKFGNFLDWWSPETLENYNAKAKCLEDQYNKFPVPELNSEPYEKMRKLDGSGDLSENMADNGGIKIAFMAYKRYVNSHGTEKLLPELKNLTSEQLFFIGYAESWCKTETAGNILNTIWTDVHAPNKYRVQIPLSNSDEFADTWKCPKGSKMNPHHKCKFW